MLELVAGTTAKKAAQRAFRRAMHAALPPVGEHTVGFPGDHVELDLRGAGDQGLWYHGRFPHPDHPIQRHLNSFGVYRAGAASQDVTVEINVPSDTNTRTIAGFFARDPATGAIFLMHSGRVGGGRPGIGKESFLEWCSLKPQTVIEPDGTERSGIVITALGDNVTARVWRYVQLVRDFKVAVRDGALSTEEAKARLEGSDRYEREFSGWKSGTRSAEFEYLSYHGDIVHELRKEAIDADDAIVGKTGLIDLFLRRDGRIAELFEVKTGARRQALYTAIGQLVTHSAALPGEVVKWLVVPADEEIADDLSRAIHSLGVRVRRFKLDESGDHPKITLLPKDAW